MILFNLLYTAEKQVLWFFPFYYECPGCNLSKLIKWEDQDYLPLVLESIDNPLSNIAEEILIVRGYGSLKVGISDCGLPSTPEFHHRTPWSTPDDTADANLLFSFWFCVFSSVTHIRHTSCVPTGKSLILCSLWNYAISMIITQIFMTQSLSWTTTVDSNAISEVPVSLPINLKILEKYFKYYWTSYRALAIDCSVFIINPICSFYGEAR